jgi:hypothetical protein
VPVATGANRIRMNVSDLRAGMYMLCIGDENQRIGARFVKTDR